MAKAGRSVMGVIGVVIVLAACGSAGTSDPPDPPDPSTSASSPDLLSPTPSPTPSPSDSEALYDYCDRAVGKDDLCHTRTFGNNLRALNDSLDGVEEWGGVRETTATAQGMTAAPVGSTVDMLMASLPLDLSEVIDSDGPCTASLDRTAQLGVVAVRMPGPRGDVDVIHAYLIGNPVVRTSDGLGVGSSLSDVRAAHPDLVVEPTVGGSLAATPVEQALEVLAAPDTRRVMAFWLNVDEQVTGWSVGIPRSALALCEVG